MYCSIVRKPFVLATTMISLMTQRTVEIAPTVRDGFGAGSGLGGRQWRAAMTGARSYEIARDRTSRRVRVQLADGFELGALLLVQVANGVDTQVAED